MPTKPWGTESATRALQRFNEVLGDSEVPLLQANAISRDALVRHSSRIGARMLVARYPVPWAEAHLDQVAIARPPEAWREAPEEFRAHEHNRVVLRAFVRCLQEKGEQRAYVIDAGEQRSWNVELEHWNAFIEETGLALNFVDDIIVLPHACDVSCTMFHHGSIELIGWTRSPEILFSCMESAAEPWPR